MPVGDVTTRLEWSAAGDDGCGGGDFDGPGSVVVAAGSTAGDGDEVSDVDAPAAGAAAGIARWGWHPPASASAVNATNSAMRAVAVMDDSSRGVRGTIVATSPCGRRAAGSTRAG